MAITMKVDKISQIVKLKQFVQRWRTMSLLRRHHHLHHADYAASDGAVRRVASGFIAVYVGSERRRFVIPTRYLNLPVFVSLLDSAAEEFGFRPPGGLILPCEIGFFTEVLKLLGRDERRLGGLGFLEFSRLVSEEVGFDFCKETRKGFRHGFTPLLQNARV